MNYDSDQLSGYWSCDDGDFWYSCKTKLIALNHSQFTSGPFNHIRFCFELCIFTPEAPTKFTKKYTQGAGEE